MTLHPGSLSLSEAGLPVRAIRRVAQSAEGIFTGAGDTLASTLDLLVDSQHAFARLRDLLDDAAGERILSTVDQSRALGTRIAQEVQTYLDACLAQRQSVRAVRAEVDELARVVRSIANISVNARIQAGGLIPPRPQVAAFIQRLDAISSDAEAILSEIRMTSARIEEDMEGIDTETKALRDMMSDEVLPALAVFARMGTDICDRQAMMATANADMSLRMSRIQDEVTRLVTGLQSGDSARQRLEHIAAVLSAIDGTVPASESALLALAARLLEATGTTARQDTTTCIEATRNLRNAATEALNMGERAYLPFPGTEMSARMEGLLASLSLRVDRLAQAAVQITQRLEAILHQERRLRFVSHQVRLSGLNAVVVCAKLGDDGRALKELAQWLRDLTEESDTITARLQTVLGAARDGLDAKGETPATRIAAHLLAFRSLAGTLRDDVARIETCRSDTAQRSAKLAMELDRKLGTVLDGLRQFQQMLATFDGTRVLLALRQSTLPPSPLADPAVAAVLDRLRQCYTVQAERDLHDGLFAPSDAPAPVPAPDAAAQSDGLDDIFF